MSRYAFPTAFGPCAVAWDGAFLTAFSLPPAAALTAPISPPSWLCALVARVKLHLDGTLQDFADAPYAFGNVTDFQRRVYEQTLAVKPGHTRSYGSIATALSLPPGGSRAVAAALGANPWPLLIPCHRIIGTDGKMTGFSGPGGIVTKTKLLALEGAQLL